MTEKQTELLEDLKKAFDIFSVKLFGNGTRVGCMDERLENVEQCIKEIKDIMPTLVTRVECKANRATRWSKWALIIGLIVTYIGLFLRVMEVI